MKDLGARRLAAVFQLTRVSIARAVERELPNSLSPEYFVLEIIV